MADFICIKTYGSRPEAELAKGFLEFEGIKAMVFADDVGGMNPALLWSTGGARLLVKKEDAQKANELLERLNE